MHPLERRGDLCPQGLSRRLFDKEPDADAVAQSQATARPGGQAQRRTSRRGGKRSATRRRTRRGRRRDFRQERPQPLARPPEARVERTQPHRDAGDDVAYNRNSGQAHGGPGADADAAAKAEAEAARWRRPMKLKHDLFSGFCWVPFFSLRALSAMETWLTEECVGKGSEF